MEPETPPDNGDQLTTFHVRRAREGDAPSLEWVVNRFAPVLLANARYRLGKGLSKIYDPEAIVNDVWAVALPKRTMRSLVVFMPVSPWLIATDVAQPVSAQISRLQSYIWRIFERVRVAWFAVSVLFAGGPTRSARSSRRSDC